MNIAKVKADPNKPFLEELVRISIDIERSYLEEQQAKAKQIESEALEAELKLQATKEEENSNQKQREIDNKKNELEKVKLSAQIAKHGADAQLNKLPILFALASKLDTSLRGEDIKLSLRTLTDIVAVCFGFASTEELLEKAEFNNTAFNSLAYIYAADTLEKFFESELKYDDIDDDVRVNCIESLFEILHSKHNIQSINTLDETPYQAIDFLLNSQYSFFDYDEVTSVMAETNTIFDEISFDEQGEVTYDFDNGLLINFIGCISGYEREDASVVGQSLSIYVTIQAPIIIGKYGLADFRVDKVKAEALYE